METFLLILLMLAAVLASSVIDQLVPKVSSPLIQIGLGLAIAVVAGRQIDLLFDEIKHSLLLLRYFLGVLDLFGAHANSCRTNV